MAEVGRGTVGNFGKINPSQGSRNVGVGAIHLHGNCTRRRRLQPGIDFKWTGCPVSLLSRLPLDRSNSKSRKRSYENFSLIANLWNVRSPKRKIPKKNEQRGLLAKSVTKRLINVEILRYIVKVKVWPVNLSRRINSLFG